MIAFIIAVFVLATIPSPALLSILAVGSAFGFRSGLLYTVGALLGANIVIILSIIGFASILAAAPNLKIFLSILSLGYLVYVAFQIARSKETLGKAEKKRSLSLTDGVIIQLVNPKAYAVGLALFSGFPLAAHSIHNEIQVKLIIVNSIFAPAYFLWLLLGETLHARLAVTKCNSTLNGSLAVLLIFSVLTAAISIFS